LRVILLIAGLLFIAGIAAFEWWRARRNRTPATVAGREDESAADSAVSAARGALPAIHVMREPRIAVGEKLPVIELDSTSASGTRRALGISISDDVATDTLRETPPREASAPPAARPAAPPARGDPYIGQDDEIGEVRVYEEQPVRGPQLVLAWPNEAERRIVNLRVVPRGEPRFAGRALRQAFASAGFWHGPLDIYHLPDEAGRVVVSAAALAQPGTFDPSIMDSQRFSGLNLFAVLPGPMSERQAFDTLVGAARALAERLEGAIHDQHGEELTAARIARLRESIQAPVQARAAGES
jgi:cell division protein ZipA